jgi:hypothetical protein
MARTKRVAPFRDRVKFDEGGQVDGRDVRSAPEPSRPVPAARGERQQRAKAQDRAMAALAVRRRFRPGDVFRVGDDLVVFRGLMGNGQPGVGWKVSYSIAGRVTAAGPLARRSMPALRFLEWVGDVAPPARDGPRPEPTVLQVVRAHGALFGAGAARCYATISAAFAQMVDELGEPSAIRFAAAQSNVPTQEG